MDGCIFCRIVAGELPADVVYRDERVIAIRDRDPQAPVHLLVLPLRHAASVIDLVNDDTSVAALFATATRLGAQHAPGGFRLVVSTGKDGGQTIGHAHVHLLGGRAMGWPPG